MTARPLAVYFHSLSNTVASEHIYAKDLQVALAKRDVRFVNDWRDADIVHLIEVNLLTVDTIKSFNYLTLFRILRSDVPVVVSADDLYFIDRPELTAHPSLYQINQRAQQWLLNRVDATIAISESVRSTLSGRVNPERIVAIKHGVDEAYFVDPEQQRDEGYVLHVSLASKRKNPEAIIEVAERLDTRFVIAGSGWDELIPDRLKRRNVDVVGYIPEQELIDLYQRASVFYFPTRHEGFGLPLLEAMAAGTAVVTSNVYSVPEVVGDAAVMCDPEDHESQYAMIRQLLGDDDERRGLARAGHDRARRFKWDRTAAQTEQLYQQVISSDPVSELSLSSMASPQEVGSSTSSPVKD